MADLFVTLIAIVPKPSTLTTVGPKADGGNTSNNGAFTTIQNQQVMSPGLTPGK